MLKKLLIGLAVIIVGFLIVVALQPADYRVARSTTVAAPPAAVFPQVNELQKWATWNPWGKLDPNMKQSFEGPPAGKGAIYKWAGNSEVGEGSMTIVESRPNELVQFRLEFVKPMAGFCDTAFEFKPEGSQTAVTWTMTGKNNFVGKAMCLFMSMDKIVGGQFEQGLGALKTIVEAEAKK